MRVGRVYGVEVTATSVPRRADARQLLWLAAAIGSQFAGGVVFHTGPEVIELAPRVLALPICSLWGDAVEGSPPASHADV